MRSFWKKTVKIVSASGGFPPSPRLPRASPQAAEGIASRSPQCCSRQLLWLVEFLSSAKCVSFP